MRRSPRVRRQLEHLPVVDLDQRAYYAPLPPAGQVSQAPAVAALAVALAAAATEPSAAVTPVRRLEPRVLPGSDVQREDSQL